jgi:hypothetical protein
VASTRVSARVSPTLSMASKRLNRPRTLDRPMWRTLKCTPECMASSGQVPAARGRSVAVVVAGSVPMDLPCDLSNRLFHVGVSSSLGVTPLFAVIRTAGLVVACGPLDDDVCPVEGVADGDLGHQGGELVLVVVLGGVRPGLVGDTTGRVGDAGALLRQLQGSALGVGEPRPAFGDTSVPLEGGARSGTSIGARGRRLDRRLGRAWARRREACGMPRARGSCCARNGTCGAPLPGEQVAG